MQGEILRGAVATPSKENEMGAYYSVCNHLIFLKIRKQMPLKITPRRLEQEFDRNTHIRSTSYQDGYQPGAVVGYG